MRKSIIGAVCACLAVVSFSADAALVGRLAATPGGTDYQAYYDTEADLTWLADANYAQTSGYNVDGLMNWQQSMDWAAGLNIGDVDGWRLPSSLNADGPDPCPSYNCTGIEMGNLFYNVLGGTAGQDIGNSHNANYDLFSNVQDYVYWSATEYAPNTDIALSFGMNRGFNGSAYKSLNAYAWAVQSGDVSAVPIPAAVWLFGSGLIGLVGLARRKAGA